MIPPLTPEEWRWFRANHRILFFAAFLCWIFQPRHRYAVWNGLHRGFAAVHRWGYPVLNWLNDKATAAFCEWIEGAKPRPQQQALNLPPHCTGYRGGKL